MPGIPILGKIEELRVLTEHPGGADIHFENEVACYVVWTGAEVPELLVLHVRPRVLLNLIERALHLLDCLE